MLERVVAACQLWCRASQWRCDLGTLMKYVCKVLIYHPPKNWHSIMILCCCSRLWMLGSSTPSESEIINTFGWLPSHNRRRSNIKMVLENDYNQLPNMLSSLSILLWLEVFTCHQLLAGWSQRLFCAGSKYFEVEHVISRHISPCTRSAQPAMTISVRQDWVLMTMTHTMCVGHNAHFHNTQAFLFRKALKQLRFDEGKEQSCGWCQFLQSPASHHIQL